MKEWRKVAARTYEIMHRYISKNQKWELYVYLVLKIGMRIFNEYLKFSGLHSIILSLPYVTCISVELEGRFRNVYCKNLNKLFLVSKL
jgi:hypothetical protein